MSKWIQKPPLGAQIDWGHPLAPNVGCWLLNEGSGNLTYDLSLNRHHGKLMGMTPSVSLTGWIPGLHGISLAFDGSNDYVDCGVDCIGTKAVSCSFWLFLSNIPASNCRIITNGMFKLYISTGMTELAFQSDGATNAVAGNVMLVGKWLHLIVTRTDSGIVNFYVNGVRVGDPNQASGIPQVATSNLFIGSNGSAVFFPGLISSVMIRNRILTAQEIWQLYVEPYCFIRQATKEYWPPMFRGLITFDRVITPAGSFWPTHNPNYGDGYARTIRRYQPVNLCGADVYSYNKGASENLSLGWNRMPAADLASLVAFFDSIHGAANKFVFTDRDGGVHTAQLTNDDSLTWREAEPGYHEVQVDLDLT